MRKWILVICTVCLFMVGIESKSHAGLGLGLSLGGNYLLLVNDKDNSDKLGMSAELNVSYQLLFVSLDMGVVFDFLQHDLLFRPGAKLHLGWFYFRLALPMDIYVPIGEPNKNKSRFNFGILAGFGVRFKFGKIGIFAEANISPFFLELNNRGVLLPAELRLGVGYYF